MAESGYFKCAHLVLYPSPLLRVHVLNVITLLRIDVNWDCLAKIAQPPRKLSNNR